MKKVTSARAKITVKDEWVAAAITDDHMVVELLVRLKQAGTTVSENPSTNLPPLRWGVRQRRSRFSRFGGGVTLKKDVDSAKGSPKTPLSWSDGSGSGGGSESPSAAAGDGVEETSRQASCSTSTGSRSKAFPTNEITSSFSKRLRKKKSSLELKYEENLKLKERQDLQKEIACLRATLEEQNVRNQRLKRIKLDLNSGRAKNETPVNLIHNSQGESNCCRVEGNKTDCFFLPDLNMAPSEDDILL